MNRKALGRGLSALIGEEKQRSGNEDFIEIDIDLLEPNSEQPRTRFNDEKLEELSQSIKSNGLVQPIIVRRKGVNFEIVAGERRWRASQKAGLKKVPAIVKDVSDDKLLELALIENIQRQELNAIEEAKAYKRLIETVGLTQEMIAERVGKNRTFITNYIRLLRLPDDIQLLVSEEKLTAGHARTLLTIENEEIQRKIAKNIIEMSLSVRETEKTVKRLTKNSGEAVENKRVIKKLDANLKAAEVKLRRHFGTQIKILPDGRGTGGKIEFEYYSESDLDRIFQLLLQK